MDNEREKAICRRITLIAIKYAPVVLSITTSLKIFLICLDDEFDTAYSISVNWINLLLNVAILSVFYAMGRYFGYCWKHRSLCRTCMFGYAFYAMCMITRPPKTEALPLAVIYVIVVLTMACLYKKL